MIWRWVLQLLLGVGVLVLLCILGRVGGIGIITHLCCFFLVISHILLRRRLYRIETAHYDSIRSGNRVSIL